ncbi:putative lem3 cdc50 family protein [Botrytis cinerea BcDW1]|uniref:Similar to CDC50 family protein n=2 Tax=Botryotinia fuckeliana TaxID=40559 RepID=G2YBR2_BOTF4|nr:putative lem3 cdc50 family protein [Botrytis cinerea BcDW1]CCD34653.1 similar to CDC50 family protein [Botrytis cinerea T4]
MADQPPAMQHEDSISSQDPHLHGDKGKTKSRRPANTAFRQQRLKAWQPILTPKTVLPLFFAIGIIFAPIGGGLLYASSVVQEIVLDYSKCHTDAPTCTDYLDTGSLMPDDNVEMFFKTPHVYDGTPPQWCRQDINQTYYNGSVAHATVPAVQCRLTFPIKSEMEPPVLFYYKLTNFYQNHRRYAKSFDSDQLSGKAVTASTIHSGDCTPLTTVNDNGVDKPYYPCGLAPNSVFNDTFSSPFLQNVANSTSGGVVYPMKNNSDVSWSSDRELYGQTKYNWSDVIVPPNWVERYPNNYSDDYHPDLENDQAFQVWMRLAGLPTFSKLFQRNDDDTMTTGQYQVNITHLFNVTEYGGTKSIVLSTRTVMGGKNPFLGIAYIVVGGLCILLGALFTVTHLIKPRKLGDHTYLSWNNDNPTTATTSGREMGASMG